MKESIKHPDLQLLAMLNIFIDKQEILKTILI